jgi:hypothetical protein
MSARGILKQADQLGVRLILNGDNLAWKAGTKPPDCFLAGLKEHKPEIIALLRSDQSPEPDAAAIAAEQAEIDKVEERVQAELKLLRADNAAIYARQTPWRIK